MKNLLLLVVLLLSSTLAESQRSLATNVTPEVYVITNQNLVRVDSSNTFELQIDTLNWEALSVSPYRMDTTKILMWKIINDHGDSKFERGYKVDIIVNKETGPEVFRRLYFDRQWRLWVYVIEALAFPWVE